MTADGTNTISEYVTYTAAGVTCQGWTRYNSRNCAQTSTCPAVIIIHDYNGLTTYEQDHAVMITDNLGYVTFCADIYGTSATDLTAAALEHLNDPTLYYNKIIGAIEQVSLPWSPRNADSVTQGCVRSGGCPPRPPLWTEPATQPLSPFRELPTPTTFITDSNRCEPFCKAPPAAFLRHMLVHLSLHCAELWDSQRCLLVDVLHHGPPSVRLHLL